ncbi:MAG: hypothetical protein COV33_01440 [Candidatus Zambryskibacteria bacterium CG10_big_fil_rev_8_21_14_0_10_34_34]|uniref:DUF488 domain-containing protein n=1 Tax=Candidatus Zambryskibacteria bacterium CG10_big_fil_rev_8_21_14_0_10_34_34 TaxID=1975114 RepID=A0A2H0R0T7_9BACT|nr:MAG: hypothetical protein COV33_01440 [Candidatus Zambryskibacteria bacterium CG10_big_fil_rev_8_21_14_0_10_34_34]
MASSRYLVYIWFGGNNALYKVYTERKRALSWKKFKRRYLAEIRRGPKLSAVKALVLMATKQDIIILCIERSHKRCHRSLLASECRRHKPNLIIEHR